MRASNTQQSGLPNGLFGRNVSVLCRKQRILTKVAKPRVHTPLNLLNKSKGFALQTTNTDENGGCQSRKMVDQSRVWTIPKMYTPKVSSALENQVPRPKTSLRFGARRFAHSNWKRRGHMYTNEASIQVFRCFRGTLSCTV